MMYALVDLCWQVIAEERVVFWPVFRKPGRQRKSRLAFDHPSEAAIYGLKLQNRYKSIWTQQEQYENR